MSQEPDYWALWKDGTDLLRSLSHLSREIGEMAWLDTPSGRGDSPDLRERVREAARQLDLLVQEPRFGKARLGHELSWDVPDDEPECRYAMAVGFVVAAVEELLLEMTLGRTERYAEYWPRKGRELDRVSLSLELALEQLEGTPPVKEELLRRARGESQPEAPAEPTARKAGRADAQDHFLVAVFQPPEEEGVGLLEDLTPAEAAATEKALSMLLTPFDPDCFGVKLVSDSEARADLASYMVLRQQVRSYDEKEEFSLMIPIPVASSASKNDWFGLRRRARELAQIARRHRPGEPAPEQGAAVQDADQSENLSGSTRQDPTPPVKRKGEWAHDGEPPLESAFNKGPLEGSLIELARWVKHRRQWLRDRNGKNVWVQFIESRRYKVWFNSLSEFSDALKRREEERKSAKEHEKARTDKTSVKTARKRRS